MNLVFDKDFFRKIAYSFVRAFIGVFLAGIIGLLTVPDWNTAKAALIALVIAGVTAGVRAVQSIFMGT